MTPIENQDIKQDLQLAVECMKKGGIILYPTDTIWGIGCDAKNPEAVKKIYDLKKRADKKSMLVLVDNIKTLQNIIEDIPEVAFDLIDLSSQPLTIIYDNGRNLAPNLIADDGSIGIRVTNEIFSKELCHLMRGAVVSTSANISGEKSPSTFSDISQEIKSGVDYIVKYRQNDNSKTSPSHIIKLTDSGVVKIIR